ncbi:MAG: sensor histidine kinase [Firmicutes bacterium]|nr:sensor histidine kinase [Bacillota bacterium]
MNLFLKYLRFKQKDIYIYILLIVSVELIFFLFHLPQEALMYPFLIWVTLILGYLTVDFLQERRRYLDWKELEDDFPKSRTLTEEGYQRSIEILQEKLSEQKNEAIRREQDQMDYYTLWVHQIKTPISSMRLNLQNEDSPIARQSLMELNRIEQYTNMVLTYLRLDSKSSDYVIQKIDLDKVMKGVVRKFSSEFINRKLSLDYQLESYFLLSDEKWLAFVLEQVLSNALKYTRTGTITISQNGNILEIKDTGIGIDSSDLSRVFEKGYTGFNGRMDQKASGIGLYLSKRICDNLHHKIWIESEIGKGTSVFIQFLDKKIGIE